MTQIRCYSTHWFQRHGQGQTKMTHSLIIGRHLKCAIRTDLVVKHSVCQHCAKVNGHAELKIENLGYCFSSVHGPILRSHHRSQWDRTGRLKQRNVPVTRWNLPPTWVPTAWRQLISKLHGQDVLLHYGDIAIYSRKLWLSWKPCTPTALYKLLSGRLEFPTFPNVVNNHPSKDLLTCRSTLFYCHSARSYQMHPWSIWHLKRVLGGQPTCHLPHPAI